MSKQQSFARVVNLKVFATGFGEANSQPTISYGGGYTLFSSVQPNGTPGYRIRGKVNKIEASVTVITNPITFSIYNLGPLSRAVVQSKVGTKVVLEAGYVGAVRQLCVGNILWANTHKEGASDYVTDIIASDGGYAITNGVINVSFAGSVSYTQVINSLIDSLADVGIQRGDVIGIPGGGYNNGIVLSGSPMDLLKQTCNKLELSCSVQNGNIVIVPLGQDKGSPPILISPETGLIGIPELRTQGLIGPVSNPGSTTPTNMISFKCLMRPELELFSKITMKSKFINGDYIAARVSHDFDSWEGPFYTNCECASA